jgi:4-amino-4-deoxy-L-arabinose transferase-like glycosyltransferase
MERRNVQRLSLLAVMILAAALRVYQLKDVPAGLFCDEAALGYNAWAIGSTGMDENAKYFPLFVWSFGGYKNPIYIYTAILPVKLLGLDEFSLRLTSVLFGVGTIIGVFFLGRALFTPWVGFFAALFLTLCPWHLHFSRIAFELISFPFLFVIGLTLLVRYTQGKRALPAAMFFFGLCLYAYAIAAVFVPLFLIGFGLLYLPTLLRRWRETLLAVVVVLATVAPAGWFYHTHQQGTQYFLHTTSLSPHQTWRTQAERFAHNYAEFFTRRFLFESGGDPVSRHSVHGFGELLPFYAPFLILGVLVVALRRDRISKLLLWWLALYPVGASLMNEIPSASRGFIGATAFCLLTAIGFAAALRALGWAARWRPLALALQATALAAAAYVMTPQVTRYLQAYFVDYPKYSAPTYGGFQYGYRDVIHYMEPLRGQYDLLMMTAVEVNQPQIFPLFYNRIDPRDWVKRHDPGYLILDPAEYSRYSMSQRILYALRPSDLEMFSDYSVRQRIVAPGGQVEFVIAEVRARKQFLTKWQVLGLFLNDGNQGVKQDFIDVQHLTKDAYKGAFGPIYWRPISPQFVRVDLNAFFATSDPRNPGNPEYVCAYAALLVASPSARQAFLEISGSDDVLLAWLNGRTLTPAPMMLSDTVKRRAIDLAAGKNVLLVKSCESVGTWYFTARITDVEGRDIPGVTTVAELPEAPIPAVAVAADSHVQLVEGFGTIVAFKHTEGGYPDYRGGSQSWWAYVRDPQSEVVWRTAPCPHKQRTILVFTASMSESPGEADLFVNGTYALTFSTGKEHGTRTWERGPYHLTFVPKASAGGDSGFMLLDLPAEQVTAGQPVEVRVVPVRADDDSWFMIKSYQDTITKEQVTPELAAELVRASWQTRTN